MENKDFVKENEIELELELELELGLSIGGSYKRQPPKFVCLQTVRDLKQGSTFDADAMGRIPTWKLSSLSSSFMGGTRELNSDPKMKREIRRQEAKNKTEGKRLKRGFNGSGTNAGKYEDVWVVGHSFQAKDAEDPETKKSKRENPGCNGNVKHETSGCYPTASTWSSMSQGVPVQVQYVAPVNGLLYPCAKVNVIPYLFMGGLGSGKVMNVGSSIAGHSFEPIQAMVDSENNGTKDIRDRGVGSSASSLCTSSAGSDHRSSLHEGSGCSDTRSHSSQSLSQLQPNVSTSKNCRGPSENSFTSHLVVSTLVNEAMNPRDELQVMQKLNPTRSYILHEEVKVESSPDPTHDDTSNKENPPSLTPKGSGKPPKPQNQNQRTPSLPCMPCVSTTGNGPNGKTVNGFLYRYTKSEVCIVCICHGSSFSPAEFVQHAGGTYVSNPLKHITVISSSF